jgi:uncharacterized damage-inducible protein DinB
MITVDFARTMARYNAWQNRSIYMAADDLDDAAREADRGAFFGSIRATLSHLMWGDLMWMSRLDGGAAPQGGIAGSGALFDWATLRTGRPRLDARIAAWAWSVSDADLRGDLTWHSGALGREVAKPMGLVVAHVFNHQTHHRGQVHAMLTAAGARPGDTDLFILPDDVPEWH